MVTKIHIAFSGTCWDVDFLSSPDVDVDFFFFTGRTGEKTQELVLQLVNF